MYELVRMVYLLIVYKKWHILSNNIILCQALFLNSYENAFRYGKDPARCIIRIVQKLFPRLDIPSLIDQYVEHIHLASGGIIDVDQDYFLTR